MSCILHRECDFFIGGYLLHSGPIFKILPIIKNVSNRQKQTFLIKNLFDKIHFEKVETLSSLLCPNNYFSCLVLTFFITGTILKICNIFIFYYRKAKASILLTTRLLFYYWVVLQHFFNFLKCFFILKLNIVYQVCIHL